MHCFCVLVGWTSFAEQWVAGTRNRREALHGPATLRQRVDGLLDTGRGRVGAREVSRAGYLLQACESQKHEPQSGEHSHFSFRVATASKRLVRSNST
jgi:hypothetical protein